MVGLPSYQQEHLLEYLFEEHEIEGKVIEAKKRSNV